MSVLGLSPRGRGNPPAVLYQFTGCGSIPAWAGKPRMCRRSSRITAVYPRVGGETLRRIGRISNKAGLSPRGRGTSWGLIPIMPAGGLSPRGRGNLLGAYPDYASRGSIPAWAGKPIASLNTSARRRVYPRVGGETTRPASLLRRLTGLSPRGRGNLLAFQ